MFSSEEMFYFTLEYITRRSIADPPPISLEECESRVEVVDLDDPIVEEALLAMAVAIYGDLRRACVRTEAEKNPLLRTALRSWVIDPPDGRIADPSLEMAVLSAADKIGEPTGLVQKLFVALMHYHYVQTASIYESN